MKLNKHLLRVTLARDAPGAAEAAVGGHLEGASLRNVLHGDLCVRPLGRQTAALLSTHPHRNCKNQARIL